MKLSLIISLATLIASLLFARYAPSEAQPYLRTLLMTVIAGSILLGLRYAFKERRAGETWLDFVDRFLEYKAGRTVADFVVYEIKLLIGLVLFVLSPVRTYKEVMGSYFANPKIKAMLFVVLFLLVAESGLIHLIIHAKMVGFRALVAHSVLVLSELYICELLIGNLYYLKFSYVSVNERLKCKIGLLWMIDVPLASIRSVTSSVREIGDRTPRFAVLNSDLSRIQFSERVAVRKLFRTRFVDQIDIYLKDQDREALQARMGERA